MSRGDRVTFTIACPKEEAIEWREEVAMPGGRKTHELLLVNGTEERLDSTGAPFPVERGVTANVTDSTVRRGPHVPCPPRCSLKGASKENVTVARANDNYLLLLVQ